MTELLAALGLVFVAELGDKTQLVALGFGAQHRLRPVLIGIAVGYAVSNLLSVAVGGALGAALPTRALGLGGGVLFLGFALWTLRRPDLEEEDEDEVTGTGRHVVVSVSTAIFVAELGDKTMLTTATLASQGGPVLVWVGATIGIIASGFVGVLVGRATGARLPEHLIQAGAALLFAVFGLVLIITNV